MTSNTLTDKVKSPFTKNQRSQLLAWSKVAKDKGILPPFERKILYEGGHYNFIFVSRLNRLAKTLDMLSEAIDEDHELILEIKNAGYRCYLDAQSNAGDSDAQYCYADALCYGLFDLEEDEEQALHWMSMSADQENPEAENTLSDWYYLGFCGLEEDERKALQLLEKSVTGGCVEAKCTLASWYKEGIVVDNFFFGIAAVGENGHESIVSFPSGLIRN